MCVEYGYKFAHILRNLREKCMLNNKKIFQGNNMKVKKILLPLK